MSLKIEGVMFLPYCVSMSVCAYGVCTIELLRILLVLQLFHSLSIRLTQQVCVIAIAEDVNKNKIDIS